MFVLESLPVLLADLVPHYVAILLSVVLVLVFGEILPASLFTGPNQLQLAAYLKNVVLCLMTVLYPVAYPISLLLDHLFGNDNEILPMTRNEFAAIMMIQAKLIQKEEAMKAGRNSGKSGEKKFQSLQRRHSEAIIMNDLEGSNYGGAIESTRIDMISPGFPFDSSYGNDMLRSGSHTGNASRSGVGVTDSRVQTKTTKRTLMKEDSDEGGNDKVTGTTSALILTLT